MHITNRPFLNPNNAPASKEYAVLGRAGTTILIDLSKNIPKGAHTDLPTIDFLIFSTP